MTQRWDPDEANDPGRHPQPLPDEEWAAYYPQAPAGRTDDVAGERYEIRCETIPMWLVILLAVMCGLAGALIFVGLVPL